MHDFLHTIMLVLMGSKHVFTIGQVDDVLILRMVNGDKYKIRAERIP